MVESVEGFFYPEVDSSLCVHCDLCNKVCPSLNKPAAGETIGCYAVQLKDKVALQHCASGGAFYGIAQTVCLFAPCHHHPVRGLHRSRG